MRILRCTAAVLLLAVGVSAADPLAIVNAGIQQTEDGAPLPKDFTYVPGETAYFSFEVKGYQPSSENKVRLNYTITAMDPAGIKIIEPIESMVDAELTPQDKEWKPKIRQAFVIPPLAPSGEYKIVAAVRDTHNGQTANAEVKFTVRGKNVEPSPTLAIRNFHFYKAEEDREPMINAVYKLGQSVWIKFDIVGFKYGEHNQIDVDYVMSILSASGKTLWTQPQPAQEQTSSYYPKRYVPGAGSVELQPGVKPAEYFVQVTAHDKTGNQTAETRGKFTVQ